MTGPNESGFTFALLSIDHPCDIHCVAFCDQRGYRLAQLSHFGYSFVRLADAFSLRLFLESCSLSGGP